MKKQLKIAMMGQKRVPSREGGIELVVEELCTRMVQKGNQVTCYNRSGHHVSGSQYDVGKQNNYILVNYNGYEDTVECVRSLIIFVIYIYFLVSQGKKLKTIGKNVLIAISGAIALINTGFLNRFIVTFTSSDYEGSSIARQYAYEHFLSVFIANPLFGFGFASPGNYNDLVYGNLGIASVDDVGIVGQMARFGIFAFVIIVPVVLRMFSVCRRLKNNKYTYYPIFVGFSLYVLVTCATLSILDPQRIALLPVLLGLFEYANYSVEKTQ